MLQKTLVTLGVIVWLTGCGGSSEDGIVNNDGSPDNITTASDFTGQWSGTMSCDVLAELILDEPILMTLSQSDNQILGSVGLSFTPSIRVGIQGTVQGNRATLTNRGVPQVVSPDETWVLTLSNNMISGQLSGELENGVPEFCFANLIK